MQILAHFKKNISDQLQTIKNKKDKKLKVGIISLLLYKKCKLHLPLKKNIKQPIKNHKNKKDKKLQGRYNLPIII